MTAYNNPLRQYFRRPAIYLKLPSGGTNYSADVIEPTETGELPVYPMTAIDDITAKTPDALFNGNAVSEIIRSCIPNIKNPWYLESNDLDAILIAIKSASSGDNLDIETKCTKCSETSTYTISLVHLLTTLKVGNYDDVLEVGDLKIKFKPLVYKEINEVAIAQFEVQKTFTSLELLNNEEEKTRLSKKALEDITFLTMDIISRTIAYIQTPTTLVDNTEFILEFIKNCDKNTFELIKEYNAKLKASSELKPLDIKCTSCGHEYSQPFTLNPSDFFG